MKQNRFLLIAILLLLLPLYILTFMYIPFAFETMRYLFGLPPADRCRGLHDFLLHFRRQINQMNCL